MTTRKKAPKKKKAPPTGKVSQLYPEGTPLDPTTGEPLEDVKISQARGKKIPLDKESARVTQQYKDVMRRKASGELSVRWNSDHRIRFGQAKNLHPRTKVSFRQLAPVEDENIPARDMSAFRDYDEVISYLRETHWKGEAATYKWVVCDDGNPQWATGQIHFAADQDVLDTRNGSKKKEEPMSHQPPWGYPPPGGYPPPPPPGYGYPSPYQHQQPQYPPQTFAPEPQPPPPQQPPQPPPAPPPMPSRTEEPVSEKFLNGMMQQLHYLMAENARLQAATQQQQPHYPPAQPPVPPGYLEWLAMQQNSGGAPSHQPNPTEPEPVKQPSVTEQVRDTMGLILELNNLGKSFTQAMDPQAQKETDAIEQPKPEEPAFPLQIKEVGPMRMVAANGQLMKDATTLAMFNADKIGNAFDKLFDKAAKLVKDREEAVDKHAAIREKKIADLERLTAAKERWNKAMSGALPTAPEPEQAPAPVPEPTPEPPKPMTMMVPPTMAPPQTLGVPIGGSSKPEPSPFANMKPVVPMEPPIVEQPEEDGEEMHPAVRFAIEKEKQEAGEFVMPKNPEPINTAEPEQGEAHPAVALAEAQESGKAPPLVNGVTIEEPDEGTSPSP